MFLKSYFNKLVLGGAIVSSLFGVGGCSNDTTHPYSEGDRIGIVTKLSSKGHYTKSWEGEMAMENFDNNSNTFSFSVKGEDTTIVRQLEEAMDNGSRVKLHYKQVTLNDPTESESDYFISNVKVLPLPQAPQAKNVSPQ